MYKFSKYKEQYKLNLKLAIPVILSQLGQVVVQLADNAMVGHYGGDDPVPLAAVSFGGGVFCLFFFAIMGLTFGITPLVGELFAQGSKNRPAKYLQNSIVLYSGLAVVLTALLFAILPLMHHMGQPVEVIEQAIPYYKAMVWSMIPVIVFFTFKQFLEGIGNTKVAMYIVTFSNIVNVILNYMLIGGHWGAPEMGALGAGISTLISRVILAVVIVYYFVHSERFRIYRERFSRHSFSLSAMKRLIALGFPIGVQIFFEAGAFIIIGFFCGLFNSTAISANQIATTMGNVSFMIIVAVGSATTIRISHCYGHRNYAEMNVASMAAWHLALLWNITMAITYYIFRFDIPRIFTSNQEVIELTSILLLSIAAYQITDGIQCIGVGILRGMQDVAIIPLISFVSYWICNIPIGYLCGFTLNMGVTGLYVGFFVGFTVASVLLYLRIKHRQRELHMGRV